MVDLDALEQAGLLYAGSVNTRPQQAVTVAATDGEFDVLVGQFGLLPEDLDGRPSFPDQAAVFLDPRPDVAGCPLSARLLGVSTPADATGAADVVVEVSAVAYGVAGCSRDVTPSSLMIAAVPAQFTYEVTFVIQFSAAAPGDVAYPRNRCYPSVAVSAYDCLPSWVRDFQWYDDRGDYP